VPVYCRTGLLSFPISLLYFGRLAREAANGSPRIGFFLKRGRMYFIREQAIPCGGGGATMSLVDGDDDIPN
jgi:hypothetical protein